MNINDNISQPIEDNYFMYVWTKHASQRRKVRSALV